MNLNHEDLEINSLRADNVGWNMGIVVYFSDITPAITPARIIETTARLSRLPVDEIMGDKRRRAVARPRQIAMLIMREACPRMSFPAIAKEFGRDHTTVLHGIKIARQTIKQSPVYRDLYWRICESLTFAPAQFDHEEPKMKWNEREDAVLRQAWKDNKSCKEIALLLEGRTYKAVEARARKLKLPKRGYFVKAETVEEDLKPVEYAEPSPRASVCQWISGEPKGDDSNKCGKPTIPGPSPYCEEHMKLCWAGHEWRGSDRPAPRPELRSDFR